MQSHLSPVLANASTWTDGSRDSVNEEDYGENEREEGIKSGVGGRKCTRVQRYATITFSTGRNLEVELCCTLVLRWWLHL